MQCNNVIVSSCPTRGPRLWANHDNIITICVRKIVFTYQCSILTILLHNISRPRNHDTQTLHLVIKSIVKASSETLMPQFIRGLLSDRMDVISTLACLSPFVLAERLCSATSGQQHSCKQQNSLEPLLFSTERISIMTCLLS